MNAFNMLCIACLFFSSIWCIFGVLVLLLLFIGGACCSIGFCCVVICAKFVFGFVYCVVLPVCTFFVVLYVVSVIFDFCCFFCSFMFKCFLYIGHSRALLAVCSPLQFTHVGFVLLVFVSSGH